MEVRICEWESSGDECGSEGKAFDDLAIWKPLYMESDRWDVEAGR